MPLASFKLNMGLFFLDFFLISHSHVSYKFTFISIGGFIMVVSDFSLSWSILKFGPVVIKLITFVDFNHILYMYSLN